MAGVSRDLSVESIMSIVPQVRTKVLAGLTYAWPPGMLGKTPLALMPDTTKRKQSLACTVHTKLDSFT